MDSIPFSDPVRPGSLENSTSEKVTVVGPPVTLAELAEVIEAGQSGGVDTAFKKHAELVANKEKIRQTLRAQRVSRTTRVKSKLP